MNNRGEKDLSRDFILRFSSTTRADFVKWWRLIQDEATRMGSPVSEHPGLLEENQDYEMIVFEKRFQIGNANHRNNEQLASEGCRTA